MVEIKIRKNYIPVDKYSDYNFVGRILGSRGLTANVLEHRSGCKIMIRGRRSMKDKSNEQNFIGIPNYQHLNELLNKDVVPASGNTDNLKKSQLVKLALNWLF
uniref:KH domain-containing protein n=1 Tax=Strongyloides papillosus TaxID=174720 RepID=A0A0N5CH86_STREA